ncbi:MAG TPA: 2-(1,2-epoxy-1,2-dihydrophenyl)acetyl-CoA isomerase, partial [Phycisphaerales bacterium]|nr:2-(1,2-epoxy-1,2-dihydrophenyl)acetyl-CoA isomerase [Phycisphaerales bacterium]
MTTSALTTISLDVSDHIATITINRPDVLNAFNDDLSREFIDALKQVARDDDVRVVVITGSGRAFSSGQDLGDLEAKYVPGHVP